MASTERGANLTARQRVDQIGNRAAAMREVQRLWQTVAVDNLRGTIGTFVDAATSVVRARNRDASESASAYLVQFRQAEALEVRLGRAIYGPAAPPSDAAIAAKLRGAGLSGVINARRAGRGIDFAGENGLVKVLGGVASLVLKGARDTLINAAEKDPIALGWLRVTGGDPCGLCSMLASRGPVYKTAASADFVPHDGCGCTPEIVYQGAEIPATVVDLGKEFRAATAGKSGKDALNAWRRKLAADRTPPGTGAAGPSSPKAPVVPRLSFAERLAAAAAGIAALALAPFGLDRKPRHTDFEAGMVRAVNLYTGSEYDAINRHMRHMPLPYGYEADDVKGTIEALRATFDVSRLAGDAIVWRGMREGSGIFGDSLGGDLTGFSWLEEAFGSTSALEQRALNFAGRSGGKGVMLRVFVPAGTGAVEASGEQLEAELLLQDKLKMIVVADHGVNADGIRYLDVEASK